MKKIILIILLAVVVILFFKMSNKENKVGVVSVDPISHASMILNWGGVAIYTDPVGETKMFAGKPAPDIILLTDIHGDHLDIEILKTLSKEKTIIIAPMAVADMLPNTIVGTLLVMNNGQKTNQKTNQKMNLQGFSLEAIPMYNLPESTDSRHTKGRGNGYTIERDGFRVYVAGDTAGIREMRTLTDIDIAFVPMNLPYTMDVEEAADAVLDFKPKQVYPYHYRGQDGLSDINRFKALVNAGDQNIEVILANWYLNQ